MKKNTCEACYNIIHGIFTKKKIKHTCFKTEEEIRALIKDQTIQKFYDNLNYKGD